VPPECTACSRPVRRFTSCRISAECRVKEPGTCYCAVPGHFHRWLPPEKFYWPAKYHFTAKKRICTKSVRSRILALVALSLFRHGYITGLFDEPFSLR
jgi:hypothetical protein